MKSSASETVFGFDVSFSIPFKIIFPLIECHVLILADVFHFLIMNEILFVVCNFLFSQINFFIFCNVIFSDSLFDFFHFINLLRCLCEIKSIWCCSCFHCFKPFFNWLHHCFCGRFYFVCICISEIDCSSNTIDFRWVLKYY